MFKWKYPELTTGVSLKAYTFIYSKFSLYFWKFKMQDIAAELQKKKQKSLSFADSMFTNEDKLGFRIALFWLHVEEGL